MTSILLTKSMRTCLIALVRIGNKLLVMTLKDLEYLQLSRSPPTRSGPTWQRRSALLQPISAAPPSGGQKWKCIRLTSKRKITTSSDQVITELPSYHSSRNRSNLVSVNLVFGCLFEAFQHISQAGADTQPAKKTRTPSMRRILAPRYVMLLTCILLLVTSVQLF
jgi:hypothetical protein